jgi:hypothetical protein
MGMLHNFRNMLHHYHIFKSDKLYFLWLFLIKRQNDFFNKAFHINSLTLSSERCAPSPEPLTKVISTHNKTLFPNFIFKMF